ALAFGCRTDDGDKRVFAQELREALSQTARAVAVNEPQPPLIRQQRIVEKLLGLGDRFVDRRADEDQVARQFAWAGACLDTHALFFGPDVSLPVLAPRRAQIGKGDAHALAPDLDIDVL